MKHKTKRKRNKGKLMRSAALVMAAGLVFGAPAAAVLMPNAGIEAQAADITYDTTSLSDWTYTQDDTAKTVTLTVYNGTSTAVQIPASFDIDGTTYTTQLTNGNNSEAGLDTGVIENLTFGTGFVFPKNISYLFYGDQTLKTIDLSNVDSSNTTTMSGLFEVCTGLTSITFGDFDTSNATFMDGMFEFCTSLTSLDLTGFDTSSATFFSQLFYGCTSLTTVDLSSFDFTTCNNTNATYTVNATYSMFFSCSALTTIYTPKVMPTTTSTLPATFYLVGDDGMAHSTSPSYTDLTAAPASSIITTILDTALTTGDDTSATGSSITFNKYFVLDSEASVPAETFNYTIAAGTAQSYSVDNQTFEVLAGVGSPTIGTATFTSSETTSTTATDGVTLSDGQAYAETTVSVDFSGVTFDEPGVYRYVITETNDGAQGVTYDSADTRYLDVYVTTDDDGVLSVESYVLHTDDSTISMNDTSGTTGGTLSDKSVGYVNSYTSHDLTIAKKVSGNQAAKDKYFKIDVAISNAAPDATLPIELSGDNASADATTGNNASTLAAYRGVANPTSIAIGSDGTGSATLYLSADQSVRIDGLTSGTTYTVTETAEDYTPSITVSGDTTNSSDGDIATVSAATVTDASISADTTVTLTGTRQGAVPTGVILPVLPYVIAAGAAGVGIALTTKKKRKDA